LFPNTAKSEMPDISIIDTSHAISLWMQKNPQPKTQLPKNPLPKIQLLRNPKPKTQLPENPQPKTQLPKKPSTLNPPSEKP
jgi:hypothetical protein